MCEVGAIYQVYKYNDKGRSYNENIDPNKKSISSTGKSKKAKTQVQKSYLLALQAGLDIKQVEQKISSGSTSSTNDTRACSKSVDRCGVTESKNEPKDISQIRIDTQKVFKDDSKHLYDQFSQSISFLDTYTPNVLFDIDNIVLALNYFFEASKKHPELANLNSRFESACISFIDKFSKTFSLKEPTHHNALISLIKRVCQFDVILNKYTSLVDSYSLDRSYLLDLKYQSDRFKWHSFLDGLPSVFNGKSPADINLLIMQQVSLIKKIHDKYIKNDCLKSLFHILAQNVYFDAQQFSNLIDGVEREFFRFDVEGNAFALYRNLLHLDLIAQIKLIERNTLIKISRAKTDMKSILSEYKCSMLSLDFNNSKLVESYICNYPHHWFRFCSFTIGFKDTLKPLPVSR
ncbi:MAG: hypothetical protein VW397_07670 [Candidatus Margulisiibacteriota bacterium]